MNIEIIIPFFILPEMIFMKILLMLHTFSDFLVPFSTNNSSNKMNISQTPKVCLLFAQPKLFFYYLKKINVCIYIPYTY